MTTATDTELLVDLDSIIEHHCEHPQHEATPDYHADGNEHYVREHMPCGCFEPGELFVVCERWVQVRARVQCSDCKKIFPFDLTHTDLGRIRDMH